MHDIVSNISSEIDAIANLGENNENSGKRRLDVVNPYLKSGKTMAQRLVAILTPSPDPPSTVFNINMTRSIHATPADMIDNAIDSVMQKSTARLWILYLETR